MPATVPALALASAIHPRLPPPSSSVRGCAPAARTPAGSTSRWGRSACGPRRLLFTGGLGSPDDEGDRQLFVLAGVIGTVAGRFLRFMAIQRLGASIASPLSNLNPLVSTGLAILLLGEQVTLPILSGTVVIVAGATLLSMGGRQVGFRPWHLVLPILSAFCFGVVAIFRKDRAGRHRWRSPARAINVTTALIVFTAFLIAPRATAARWPATAGAWRISWARA